jgi:Heterokaryon incompatibility protein (HET)
MLVVLRRKIQRYKISAELEMSCPNLVLQAIRLHLISGSALTVLRLRLHQLQIDNILGAQNGAVLVDNHASKCDSNEIWVFPFTSTRLSMTLTYRDLKDGEVRLITIITDRSDPSFRNDMVCCKLGHFSLSENERSEVSRGGGKVKGWTRVWDRDHGDLEQEENSLLRKTFKKKAQDNGRNNTLNTFPASAVSFPPVNMFDEDSDNTLPWRYIWGDYVALSYLWGPKDPSTDVTVSINGEEFPVRSNLAAAMRQLENCPRIEQGFKLWIDMICINQENIQEREIQVRKMKDIYASAWNVVVWLGVEANGSDLAMATLRYLSRRHRNDPSSMQTDIICQPGWRISTSVRYTSFKRDVHVDLYRLLTRDYWYRLWILQEIALGRDDMPIICGGSHIKWSDIVAATTLIQQNEYEPFSASSSFPG